MASSKPSLRLRTSNINLKPASSTSNRSSDTTVMTSTTFLPSISSSTTAPTLVSPNSVKSAYTDLNTPDSSHTTTAGSIGIHRGAIDNTTITTEPPKQVMEKVRNVLDSIGICVQPESTFKFRCIRPSQTAGGSEALSEERNLKASAAHVNTKTIYSNDPSRDPAGEVRFSVELTRLAGLNDTYSLDIRRLKGNLRSYQFLYETIRDRAQLTT